MTGTVKSARRLEVRLRVPRPLQGGRAASERHRRAVSRAARAVEGLFQRQSPEDVADLLDSIARRPAPSAEGADTPAARLARELSGGREYTAAERLELEADAQWRSFERRRALLADTCSASEVAVLLGTSRQTPHDRVRADRLLGILDRGHLRFPRWQFDAEHPDGVVAGLTEVLAALRAGPLARVSWFARPNPYLDGRTPADALKQGERERVVDAAHLVGAAAA